MEPTGRETTALSTDERGAVDLTAFPSADARRHSQSLRAPAKDAEHGHGVPGRYMSRKHERGCSTEGIDAFIEKRTPGMDRTVGARRLSEGVPRDS